MNYFFKKVVVLFLTVSSVSIYAQKENLEKDHKILFYPKFTIGSGIYTLLGDIQNEENGLLKGKSGFNAGMKFDIFSNIDLSFLVVKKSFSGSNDYEQFMSNLDGFGLHLGYTANQFLNQSKINPFVSLGIQRFGVSTTINDDKKDRVSAVTIPLGFGLRMNITDRLQFDITINHAFGMSDIDMSLINDGNADGYKSLNFAIHYDLFSPSKKSLKNFDNSYYADVNFDELDSEDEDGDLVPDVDDYCPQTPIGIKVDKKGCPLDDDNDGIANYIDDQKDTPKGAIVDEKGVMLTSEKYLSMYSDSEIASRKYANFYNEVQIKRENYKSIDEYLIAKANAFNKAFNESINNTSDNKELVYRVQIGEYLEGIDKRTANKLLSLDNLQSLTQKNDIVIYSVGSYSNLDDVTDKLYDMKSKGFNDAFIIIDDNGEISKFKQEIIDLDDEYIVPDNKIEEIDNQEKTIDDDLVVIKKINNDASQISYRIQIGAFNSSLSDEVFVGVKDIISFIGKDGLIRYMAGSFVEFSDAIDYRAQMIARGFDDAFIVTYQNGQRISLDVAINNTNANLDTSKNEFEEIGEGLQFTVQIMVAESIVAPDDEKRMRTLDNYYKKATGSDMYEYYVGTYSTLQEANIQLAKAKEVGFSDSFVFATFNGQRITLEQAKKEIQ